MKNFLKELYDNFPELENSKEKVDKAVYYLKDNKPFYAASNEFKTKLKTRLENITSLTSTKKSNFFIFAIPVFSLLFIVVWFAYYIKDITFLNDKTNISVRNPIENSVMKMQVVNNDVIEETFVEIWEDLSLDNTKNTFIKTEKNIVKNSDKEIVENKVDLTIKEPIIELNIEENINEATIENDDIFNFLEALWENLDDNQSFGSDVSNMWWSSLKMMWESAPMIMSDSISESESTFIMESEPIWFEDFCKNNIWTIYEAGDEKICRVDKKECLSSNYVNWVCEFKEIK